MVVAEHGVDRVDKLCVVPLVDAAAVNLTVLQLVASGLLAAEHDLAVACSTPGISADQIGDGDFFSSRSVREYGVGGEPVLGELGLGEVSVLAE